MSKFYTSRLKKSRLNLYLPFRMSGARVVCVSSDEHDVKIKLPLNIFTRNHVGTTFGGSIYSAIDGIFGILLFRHLSPEYLAVLKACTVRYKRPGKGTLYATISISKDDFNSIRKELKSKSSTERVFKFDIVDQEDVVCAEFSPTIFIS